MSKNFKIKTNFRFKDILLNYFSNINLYKTYLNCLNASIKYLIKVVILLRVFFCLQYFELTYIVYQKSEESVKYCLDYPRDRH